MTTDVSLDQLGSLVQLPIDGKTYSMSPIDIAGIQVIKGRIRSGWLDNLTQSKIDPRAHMNLRATLLSKPIPMAVVYEEMDSPEMWALILYLAIRPNDPSVTEKQFADALNKMTQEDIDALRDAMTQAMSTGVEQDDTSDFTPNSSASTGPSKSPD